MDLLLGISCEYTIFWKTYHIFSLLADLMDVKASALFDSLAFDHIIHLHFTSVNGRTIVQNYDKSHVCTSSKYRDIMTTMSLEVQLLLGLLCQHRSPR